MFFFAATVLISAFLLFQVQPLMARLILPWFGGGPAIWGTCMLFFQTLLLAGYGYAHWLSARSQRFQTILHSILLITALFMLSIVPGDNWEPTDGYNPVYRILLLLTASVGLPYLLLSTTGPLIQNWFGRVFEGRSPYRLFALSNAGSLLALLAYPLVIEPWLPLEFQTRAWSACFVVYLVLCGVCTWRAGRCPVPVRAVEDADADSANAERPSLGLCIRWLLLSMAPSVMLLATTSQLCQEVAVVPFLWIIPLSLYLLSFILCFDSDRWYRRETFLLLLFWSTVLTCIALHSGTGTPLSTQLFAFNATLFLSCMTCHGELSRSRPAPSFLTLFYFLVAAGGACGGVVVVLVAPAISNRFIEYPVGLLLSVLVTLWGCYTAREGALRNGQPRWIWGILVLSTIGLGGFLWDHEFSESGALIERSRSFYGILTVEEFPSKAGPYVNLRNGRIQHGYQFRDETLRYAKTSYYGSLSGIGVAIERHPARVQGQPMHLGVIGLGTGSVAVHGLAGDRLRFYEISPDVERVARKHFSYLDHCEARVDVVLGDARIQLKSELDDNGGQEFDVLAVDAFSSDAIPMHLLTREAIDLYLQHLKEDGVLVIHISNQFLNLQPIVWNLAETAGLSACLVNYLTEDSDPTQNSSLWVLMSRDASFPERPEIAECVIPWQKEMPRIIWTDDYGSLWQVVRKANFPKFIRRLF